MLTQLKALKLPDLFTLAGMACAFFSIFFAKENSFYVAYTLLVLQFILDGIDGRVARKYGSGTLGLYLDSFSDFTAIIAVVLFGFYLGLSNLFFFFSAFLFITFAAIRLSFFTVRAHENMKDFTGVPTVFCVLVLSTALILNYRFQLIEIAYFSFLYLVLAFLMIGDFKIRKI